MDVGKLSDQGGCRSRKRRRWGVVLNAERSARDLVLMLLLALLGGVAPAGAQSVTLNGLIPLIHREDTEAEKFVDSNAVLSVTPVANSLSGDLELLKQT